MLASRSRAKKGSRRHVGRTPRWRSSRRKALLRSGPGRDPVPNHRCPDRSLCQAAVAGTCSDAKKESRQTRSYQDWPSLSALGSADEMRRAGLPVLLAARRQRRRTHLRADIRICRLWACRKASAQKGDRGTVRAGRSCSLPQARPGRSCKAAARRAGSPDGSLLVPKKKLPYRALSRRLSGAGPFADCL